MFVIPVFGAGSTCYFAEIRRRCQPVPGCVAGGPYALECWPDPVRLRWRGASGREQLRERLRDQLREPHAGSCDGQLPRIPSAPDSAQGSPVSLPPGLAVIRRSQHASAVSHHQSPPASASWRVHGLRTAKRRLTSWVPMAGGSVFAGSMAAAAATPLTTATMGSAVGSIRRAGLTLRSHPCRLE